MVHVQQDQSGALSLKTKNQNHTYAQTQIFIAALTAIAK